MLWRPTSTGLGENPLRRTVDRLCAEFGDGITSETVLRVVEGCLRDLAGVRPDALPELSERLARQRLLDTAGSDVMIADLLDHGGAEPYFLGPNFAPR